MSKIVNETQQQIRQAILDAMGKAVKEGTLPAEPICDFKIEVPNDTANGDFSSNVAMMSTKAFRMNPRKIECHCNMTSLIKVFSEISGAIPFPVHFSLLIKVTGTILFKTTANFSIVSLSAGTRSATTPGRSSVLS